MRLAAPIAGAVLAALAAGATAGARGERPAPGGALIAYWRDSPWPTIWTMRPDGSRHRRNPPQPAEREAAGAFARPEVGRLRSR